MISSLLFLGTGASLGVPLIGCHCEVCTSKTPFNKRLRTSALLKVGDKRLLIDPGPDYRQQALFHNITHLDGVVITHAHQDHVAGVDDLRPYSFKSTTPLDCLMSQETAHELTSRFFFMFKEQSHETVSSRLRCHILEHDVGCTLFHEVSINYFSYHQQGMKVTGIRVGDMAYVTDIHDYPPEVFESLRGVKTLVISALRHTASHMHLTVDQAVDFSDKVGAEQVYLTHLSHELDYLKTNSLLPEHVRLAYDGLEISFKG